MVRSLSVISVLFLACFVSSWSQSPFNCWDANATGSLTSNIAFGKNGVLTDGDITTGYTILVPTNRTYIDLGAVYWINDIRSYNYFNGAGNQLQINASIDNATWDYIGYFDSYSGVGVAGWGNRSWTLGGSWSGVGASFTPRYARYLSIQPKNNNGYFNVFEVWVFSQPETCVIANYVPFVIDDINYHEAVYAIHSLNNTANTRILYKSGSTALPAVTDVFLDNYTVGFAAGQCLNESIKSLSAYKNGSYVYAAYPTWGGTTATPLDCLEGSITSRYRIIKYSTATSSVSSLATYEAYTTTNARDDPRFYLIGHSNAGTQYLASNWTSGKLASGIIYANGSEYNAESAVAGVRFLGVGSNSTYNFLILNDTGTLKYVTYAVSATYWPTLVGTTTTIYSVGTSLVSATMYGMNIMYSSQPAGNFELSTVPITCAGSCTPIQVTSTSNQESFVDFAYSSVTNFVGYFDGLTSTFNLQYLCNNVLSSTFCSGGITEGIQPNEVYLKVYDDARCPQYYIDPNQCKAAAALNEDWVTAEYMIGGKVALPASYNSANVSEDIFVKANATCRLSGGTASDDFIWGAVSWDYGISWGGLQPSKWVICAGGAGCATKTDKSSVYYDGMIGTITCNSSFSDTLVSIQFRVENTKMNVTSFINEVGSGDRYGTNLKMASSPVNFRTTMYSTVGIDSIRCWVDKTYMSSNNNLMPTVVTSGLAPSIKNVFKYSYTSGGLIAGWQRYKTKCGAWEYEALRMPSVVRMSSFFVEDICASQPYNPSTLTVTTIAPSRNFSYTSSFYPGEQILFSNKFNIVWGGQTFENYYPSSCAWSLTNVSNGYVVNSGTILSTLYSTPSIWQPNIDTYGLQSNASGIEYNFSITCRNLNPNLCVSPASASKIINVSDGAGCDGTPDSCGTTACYVCNTSQVTCEDGLTYAVQTPCSSQECTFTGVAGHGDLTCFTHQIWSVGASSVSAGYSCADLDKIGIKAQILRYGSPYQASNLGATCSVAFEKSIDVFGYIDTHPGGMLPQTYVSNQYPMTYDSQTNQFSWDNSAKAYSFECGSNYTAMVSCTAVNFSPSTKTKSLIFEIGSLDQICLHGDIGVPKYSCLSSITLDEYDKPLYCGADIRIADNSIECGCPPGQTVNSTSLGCDGVGKSKMVSGLLSLNWLTGVNVLIIIFLLPLLYKGYELISSKGHETHVHNYGENGRGGMQ